MGDKYLILNCRDTPRSKRYFMFWCSDFSGYSCKLDEAGRYDLEQIKDRYGFHIENKIIEIVETPEMLQRIAADLRNKGRKLNKRTDKDFIVKESLLKEVFSVRTVLNFG